MDKCKLKPCPFCGGKGHISSREILYLGQNYFGAKKIKMGVQVICGRCKARGGLATGGSHLCELSRTKEGT